MDGLLVNYSHILGMHITKVIYWATILYFNFARLFLTVNFIFNILKQNTNE